MRSNRLSKRKSEQPSSSQRKISSYYKFTPLREVNEPACTSSHERPVSSAVDCEAKRLLENKEKRVEDENKAAVSNLDDKNILPESPAAKSEVTGCQSSKGIISSEEEIIPPTPESAHRRRALTAKTLVGASLNKTPLRSCAGCSDLTVSSSTIYSEANGTSLVSGEGRQVSSKRKLDVVGSQSEEDGKSNSQSSTTFEKELVVDMVENTFKRVKEDVRSGIVKIDVRSDVDDQKCIKLEVDDQNGIKSDVDNQKCIKSDVDDQKGMTPKADDFTDIVPKVFSDSLPPKDVKLVDKSCDTDTAQHVPGSEFPFDDYLLDDDFDNLVEVNSGRQTSEAKENRALPRELPISHFGRHVVSKVVQKDSDELELTLWSELLNEERFCTLRGFWSSTRVKPKDIVNVLADFDADRRTVIDNDHNFLVVNPDVLVSSTSVSSMVFCRRKTVLNEWFRAMDPGSPIMMVGTLVHQLFQAIAPYRGGLSLSDVEVRLSEILSLSSNLKAMYKFQEVLSEEDLWKELQDFLVPIDSWVKKHSGGGSSSTSARAKMPSSGSSTSTGLLEIRDIEENVWCPRFGIKGKLDVTAEVNLDCQRKDFGSAASSGGSQVLPLELKTGRPTFSIEHMSQVLLYIMMLRDRCPGGQKGLLLYLRSGEMREVVSDIKKEQGLIQMRNELVHHLVNQPAKKQNARQGAASVRDDGGVGGHQADDGHRVVELPAPLTDSRLCSRCPHLQTCSLFYQTPDAEEEQASQSFETLSRKSVAHLDRSDIDYFVRWVQLLFLETSFSRDNSFQLKNIWCSTARHREKRGDCFSDMNLDMVAVSHRSGGQHQFRRRAGHWNGGQSLTSIGLTPSQTVAVSVEDKTQLAISTGTITEVTDLYIRLQLDRDLYSKPELLEAVFRIDAFTSPSANVTSLSNLGRLMEANPSGTRLRRIVVQRQTPGFKAGLPKRIVDRAKSILGALNKHQRRAVLKVLQAEDYVLIKGMPGSGKTNTIVALIRILAMFGHTVLLTSHTHSAVDNVLQKLKDFDVDFIRLGNVARVHPSLREHTEDHLLKDVGTLKDINRIYDTPRVVATTCLGSNHPIFSRRKEFDFCIVDEATQLQQPSCLGPLFYSKRFVLVGDPKQLPPIVRNPEAKALGMEECLFTRLTSPEAVVELTEQYRMNEEIQRFPNALSYGGALVCANDRVAKSVLNLSETDGRTPGGGGRWLDSVVSPDLRKAVIFLNTDRLSALEMIDQHNSIFNRTECQLVFQLVVHLLQRGLQAERLGVICPYRNQVAHLRRRLRPQQGPGRPNSKEFPDDLKLVEVNTVDQYQGRDKDVVIISFVRSSNLDVPVGENEILNDARRINVAITRAKKKLIMIGRHKTLVRFRPLKDLLDLLTAEQEVILDDTCLQEGLSAGTGF